MTEKVTEVVRSSRNGARGGGQEGVVVEMGKRLSLVMLDIIGSSSFSYEFRALESTSIGGSSNIREKSGFEVSRRIQYNPQDGWFIPDCSDAIHDISLPLRTSLPLKRTRNAAASTIRRVTAQIIAVKKSTLTTSPEDSESKNILSIILKSNTYTDSNG